MRKSLAKALLVMSALAAFGGLPSVAAAKHGADDPAGHHHGHHGGHHDDGPGHT